MAFLSVERPAVLPVVGGRVDALVSVGAGTGLFQRAARAVGGACRIKLVVVAPFVRLFPSQREMFAAWASERVRVAIVSEAFPVTLRRLRLRSTEDKRLCLISHHARHAIPHPTIQLFSVT